MVTAKQIMVEGGSVLLLSVAMVNTGVPIHFIGCTNLIFSGMNLEGYTLRNPPLTGT